VAPAGAEAERQSPQYLDATHTPSESQVYSVMYRETQSKGVGERYFGPKELMAKTGIRSDRTIRRAIDGLLEKLSIEIVTFRQGDPLGPLYRVYRPKEIERRRRDAGIEIHPQSKKIITPAITGVGAGVATGVGAGGSDRGSSDRGTPATPTGVTGVADAGASIKYRNTIGGDGQSAAGSSSNSARAVADDEAFAGLRSAMAGETGREVSAAALAELDELLTAEFKLAAGRADGVSAPAAFFAEHLRRRLWKKDKRQLDGEEKSVGGGQAGAAKVDAARCPDCFGTGMWYPEGFEKGVARCQHTHLL
jgi:hypothetical protein